MRAFFTFIVEHPLLFILLALVIYALITYNIQKKKIEEIKKAFKPLNDYLSDKFVLIEKLNNILLVKYKEEDEVINELQIIKSSIELFKSEDINDKIKASNDINNFVLNSGLLRTKDHQELQILANMQLFMPQESEESKDIEIRRLRFNELVTDFNHDILNPPNSIIVKLFGINKHYNIIENNVGKTPKEASKVVIEKKEGLVAHDGTTKVCPNCHTEFTTSRICPTCGYMVNK